MLIDVLVDGGPTDEDVVWNRSMSPLRYFKRGSASPLGTLGSAISREWMEQASGMLTKILELIDAHAGRARRRHQIIVVKHAAWRVAYI